MKIPSLFFCFVFFFYIIDLLLLLILENNIINVFQNKSLMLLNNQNIGGDNFMNSTLRYY